MRPVLRCLAVAIGLLAWLAPFDAPDAHSAPADPQSAVAARPAQ